MSAPAWIGKPELRRKNRPATELRHIDNHLNPATPAIRTISLLQQKSQRAAISITFPLLNANRPADQTVSPAGKITPLGKIKPPGLEYRIVTDPRRAGEVSPSAAARFLADAHAPRASSI